LIFQTLWLISVLGDTHFDCQLRVFALLWVNEFISIQRSIDFVRTPGSETIARPNGFRNCWFASLKKIHLVSSEEYKKTRTKKEKTNFYFPNCKFSCFSFNYALWHDLAVNKSYEHQKTNLILRFYFLEISFRPVTSIFHFLNTFRHINYSHSHFIRRIDMKKFFFLLFF
jgi:hypothetical protein